MKKTTTKKAPAAVHVILMGSPMAAPVKAVKAKAFKKKSCAKPGVSRVSKKG